MLCVCNGMMADHECVLGGFTLTREGSKKGGSLPGLMNDCMQANNASAAPIAQVTSVVPHIDLPMRFEYLQQAKYPDEPTH